MKRFIYSFLALCLSLNLTNCGDTMDAINKVYFSLDKTTATLEPGNTLTLTAIVNYDIYNLMASTMDHIDPNPKIYSWNSSDESRATVTSTGPFTARVTIPINAKEGTVTITVVLGDGIFDYTRSKATCVITIPPDGLTDDIRNLIPNEYINTLKSLGLVIHGGNNPPNIEGTYHVSPMYLVKTNSFGGIIAESDNMIITFFDQNGLNVKIDYDMWTANGDMGASGLGSFIVGEGNRFTVFAEAVRRELSYTAITVEAFSGEITAEGIKNYQWAVIMVDDNGDPTGNWIENGIGYVKRDGSVDGLAERLVAQQGKFIVVQGGITLSSYNNWYEAVYMSSTTGSNISQVINDKGEIIYKQNRNNPKYWMFQQNPQPSYASYNESDASSFLYNYENSYVFKGDGTVYGARTTGKNTIHEANDGLDADGSYVYKYSFSRSDLLSMSATLDLSQATVIANSNGQYPNNFYIYGHLFYDGWQTIDLGFMRANNNNGDWQLFTNINDIFSANYPGKTINGNTPVCLEWRLENNSFCLYVIDDNNDGTEPFHPIPGDAKGWEDWVRTHNPQFMQATTMCPIYTETISGVSGFKIPNFRDGAFLGPVKWYDCKLKLTDGTVMNFWQSDSQRSIYCNQQTTNVLQPYSSTNQTNSEIITLSRTGSFMP